MADYTQLAMAAGLPPELAQYAPRYVQIESGGNPNAQTGSYSGLLQMGPDEQAKYGGNGADAGFRMYADNAKWFNNKYGRAPSPTELYLTAQQGQGGIAQHLQAPDQPAWQNMLATGEGQKKGEAWAKKAVWGNVPDDVKPLFGNVNNVTSQQFMDLWQHKVERTPMSVAFNGKQSQGSNMADQQAPSLYDRLRAGGPGALFGAPNGVFPASDGGQGGGYDLGLALERAGAGLTSINNPAGGAAMMNAANTPLFRQRYSIVTDKYGRQYRFDVHTGAVTPINGTQVGTQAGGAPAAAPSAAQTEQDAYRASPEGQIALGKEQIDSDQKKYDALEDANTNAQDMIDLIQNQAMPLSKNKNVYQGAGASTALTAKKVARGVAGLFGSEGPAGTVETSDLDKLNSQLQAKMLAAQKGIRFAAPEIKFGQTANAEIDKPAETNQQIYSNLLQQAQRIQYATQLARAFKGKGMALDDKYHTALQAYYDAHPIYQMDQISGGGSGGDRPPLSSFNR